MDTKFPHLQDLLPKIKKAQEYYDLEYGLATTESQLQRAIDKFNLVLLEAIDAIWKDTMEVNLRHELHTYFTRMGDIEPFFGVNSYEKLLRTVEHNTVAHLRH